MKYKLFKIITALLVILSICSSMLLMPSFASSNQNLWNNGDIESEVYIKNQIYESAKSIEEISTTVFHGGKQGLRTVPTSDSVADNINKKAVASNWFNSSKGCFYMVEGWVKAKNGYCQIFSTRDRSFSIIENDNEFNLLNSSSSNEIALAENNWTKVESLMYQYKDDKSEQYGIRVKTYDESNKEDKSEAFLDDLSIMPVVPEVEESIPSQIVIPTQGNTVSQTLETRLKIEGKVLNGNPELIDYTYVLDGAYNGVSIEGNELIISDDAYAGQTVSIMPMFNGINLLENPATINLIAPENYIAPQVRNPQLIGGIGIGRNLTTSYSYYDPYNISQNIGKTQYEWWASSNNTIWEKIDNTSSSYLIPENFQYSSVKVKIKVTNTSGDISEWAETNISGISTPPVAENVAVIGDVSVDKTAEIVFDYFDFNNDLQGNHQYEWYTADDNNGTNVSSAPVSTEREYLIPKELEGKYIKVKVTPVSVAENDIGVKEESEWYYVYPRNILVNGDFENEQMVWSIVEPYSNNKIDKCIISSDASYGNGRTGMKVCLGHTVDPKASINFQYEKGTYYKIRFWAKTENIVKENDPILLSIGGVNDYVYTYTKDLLKSSLFIGKDASKTRGEYGTVLTTDWQLIEAIFYAKDTATDSLALNIIKGSGTDYPNIFIDEMMVYTLDNPLNISFQREIPIINLGGDSRCFECVSTVNLDGTPIANAQVDLKLKYNYDGLSIIKGHTLKVTDEAYAGEYSLVGVYDGIETEFPFTIINNTGNNSPQIRKALLKGDITKNGVLTTEYSYYDPNGTEENSLDTTYSWFGSTNDTDWDIIQNHSASYTIPNDFSYSAVKVSITTANVDGISTNTIETNVAKEPIAPMAHDVAITGEAKLGSILKADYIYSDENLFDKETDSIYQWYRLDSIDGTPEPIEGADRIRYKLKREDEGKYIQFSVIPRSGNAPQAGIETFAAVPFLGPASSITGQSVKIYVAPNGDDSSEGTIEKPLKTIYKARLLARKYNKENAVDIIFRGGRYFMNTSLVLNEKDSGLSESMPITYKAYDNESVEFTGAMQLDGTCFYKVTDPEILNRVVSTEARENLYAVDVKAMGINLDKEKMRGIGTLKGYYTGSKNPIIVVNGTEGKVAQWPDSGYIPLEEIISTGTIDSANQIYTGMQIKIASDREKLWLNAKDAYIFSIWNAGHWDGSVMIKNIAADGTITTDVPYSDLSISKHAEVLFYNLPEEISVEGEYYADVENEKIYFMAKSTENIALTTMQKPFIISNNLSNVVFNRITFSDNRFTGLEMDNCKNVIFDECSIKNISGRALNINGMADDINKYNSGIVNSTINNVTDGIYIMNGFVDNCVVDDFGVNNYCRGIAPQGDSKISHNIITNSDYLAMQISGKNNVIEYNDISNVCKHTGDMGALYISGSAEAIIRNNYIHDICSSRFFTSGGTKLLYLDFGASNIEVYQNLFENTPGQGIRQANGKNTKYESNVFISCRQALALDNIQEQNKSSIEVSDNIFIDIGDEVWENSIYGKNYIGNTLSIFNDYDNRDLSLTQQAKNEVEGILENFVDIDVTECGVQ